MSRVYKIAVSDDGAPVLTLNGVVIAWIADDRILDVARLLVTSEEDA